MRNFVQQATFFHPCQLDIIRKCTNNEASKELFLKAMNFKVKTGNNQLFINPMRESCNFVFKNVDNHLLIRKKTEVPLTVIVPGWNEMSHFYESHYLLQMCITGNRNYNDLFRPSKCSLFALLLVKIKEEQTKEIIEEGLVRLVVIYVMPSVIWTVIYCIWEGLSKRFRWRLMHRV